MKVTFIGLGIMGSRMASNLLKNGVELTVFNRTAAASLALEKSGARKANNIMEAVNDADYVLTMLSDPDVVRVMMLNNNGGVHAMKKESLWIDCTTVNPAFSLECKNRSDEAGIRFMDAPVTGTKPQAEKGELVFLVGAEKPVPAEVENLLHFMGNKILHLGGVSKGTSFKMLVNSMLAQSMLIFSESAALGLKMGFDPEFLFDTIPGLPVSAPFLKQKAAMIKENNFEVQFPLELMHKDLRLVNETAWQYNLSPALASLAMKIYENAKMKGLGREDFSAVYKYILDLNND